MKKKLLWIQALAFWALVIAGASLIAIQFELDCNQEDKLIIGGIALLVLFSVYWGIETVIKIKTMK